MSRLRAIWVLMLLAGLAGLASAQSTMSIALSANPITYGDSVSVIANFTGTTPCGGLTVSFYDGAALLGTAISIPQTFPPLPYNCDAVLTVSTLAAGQHALTWSAISFP